MQERDGTTGRAHDTPTPQARPRFRSKLLARLLADADDLEPFLRVRSEARHAVPPTSSTDIQAVLEPAGDEARLIADLDRVLDELGRELRYASPSSELGATDWREDRRAR